ncbi:MAG: Gfo/Idh/MocA family oxidoreductase [Phycisphaerae bacterium]|nr:Gfo/Idh/MocA family oxidoreductase [Phycisphaerae bacterium]
MNAAANAPVPVGVIGLGRSGWGIHINAMRPMPENFKIVGVTDPNAARCKEATDEFGCKVYQSVDQMLADKGVELVVVASLNRMHPPHAIQAMEAGKNVVCEKPMAADAAEADRMIAVSKKTGKMLAVFQNRRYAPDFVKVKEVIDSGKLGRIVMIKMMAHGFSRRWDWQTLKEFGGGALNNTGPHFVDQALQLFGPAEPNIFCHMENVLSSGDAEDHVKVVFSAPKSPMIDLEITSACAYGQGNWLVMGSSGGLKGTMGELEWKYVDFSKMPPRPIDRTSTPDRSYNREDLTWTEEKWEKSNDFPGEATCFYRDLYETIRNAKPLHITPESVRRQIAILEKCHQLSPV